MAPTYSPVRKEDNSVHVSEIVASPDINANHEQKEWQPFLQWKARKSLIVTIILLVVFGTAIIAFQASIPSKRDKRQLLPHLSIENIVFHNESKFSGPSSPETKRSWMDLMGPGMGFVAIQNPSQFGLAAGSRSVKKSPDFQNYGISMYHQLHCLMIIHENFWAVIREERTLRMFEVELFAEMNHLNHCFDYIRQGLMCAGDMSIESAAVSNGNKPHVNGMGDVHQCRSWQESRDWMDQNQP